MHPPPNPQTAPTPGAACFCLDSCALLPSLCSELSRGQTPVCYQLLGAFAFSTGNLKPKGCGVVVGSGVGVGVTHLCCY